MSKNIGNGKLKNCTLTAALCVVLAKHYALKPDGMVNFDDCKKIDKKNQKTSKRCAIK